MQTTTDPERLQGEGDIEHISRKRVRKCCDVCGDKPAEKKHTFLLEGMRNNPASSAYCKDDCSWCEDAAIFTCRKCDADPPPGYVRASRFEVGRRFAHLFLEWKEFETVPINIVFDGPPSHESGRFVEVEDDSGRGIKCGEWSERPDGFWALRIEALPRQ